MITIRKQKKNNNIKYIVAIILIAIIMIINLIVIIRLTKKPKSANQANNPISSESNNDDTEEDLGSREDDVKSLPETLRIKRYIGFFLEDIENGDYQSAYDVLNEDFKKTYFTNLDEFKEYADKNFNSSIMTLTYDNVERLGNSKTGNMYVVWVTISNMFQSKLKDGEELPQTNFVIIEYDYNKYEMSFSVNQE